MTETGLCWGVVERPSLFLNRNRPVQVRWGQGATEGGSSGSPLIDADTSRVVGVLTGGFSSCSQPNAPDYYGRLSAVGPLSPL